MNDPAGECSTILTVLFGIYIDSSEDEIRQAAEKFRKACAD
jgi:hypothetical protein